MLLKIVLERSWGHLGSILGPILDQKCVFFHWFVYTFVKIDFLEQVRCQDTTWAELGATWVPKRLQNGAPK